MNTIYYSHMSALIVDIETVGEKWSDIDQQTKDVLTGRVTRFHPEYSEEQVDEIVQSELGATPFTGKIVALGVLDADTKKGAVYYSATEDGAVETEENGVKLKPTTEKEMLELFWKLSDSYTHFITFSGRTFDMPYIMIRSAIHGIRPKKDLMKNRYLNYQSSGSVHIDLYDQLNFYGSFQRLGGLHLACRAFGIETPKDGHIDGSKVGEFYRAGKAHEIAQYNARDLFATAALYEKWQDLLQF